VHRGKIGQAKQPPGFFGGAINIDTDFHGGASFAHCQNLRYLCAMQSISAITTMMTPIGMIELAAGNGSLQSLRFITDGGERALTHHPVLLEAQTQINAWFAGERKDFDLPLSPLTSPRGEVLRSGIASVLYGQTLTYGALAAELASSARAVGQACRTNKFPLIIPCHRVISTGRQEYYSGGDGVRTKAWLIDFERGEGMEHRQGRLL
jgi:methylated-DNA-[protein]-cysteine S-methyltransferase